MPKNCPSLPIVMVFSASDPTGGSGIQADIETLGSIGSHCAPILTCVNAQDTRHLIETYPLPTPLVLEQAKAILEDIPVAGIKVGQLGSTQTTIAIAELLAHYSHIPCVLDPVFQVGPENELIDSRTREAALSLIPYARVCTLNAVEAKLMAPGADTLDACAHELMEKGAHYVLITGIAQESQKILNVLYAHSQRLDTFEFDYLDQPIQGAGCTLSAAITGLLARGLSPEMAIFEAQQYTATTLAEAFRAGMGQRLSNRWFWSRDTLEVTETLTNKRTLKN